MVDPAEPNLLRDDFPYTRIPPIRFEPTGVAQARPTDVWITDTTFRDGQQARAPYTVDQIVHLYDLLAKLGGPVTPSTRSFISMTCSPSWAGRSSGRPSFSPTRRLIARQSPRASNGPVPRSPPGCGPRSMT